MGVASGSGNLSGEVGNYGKYRMTFLLFVLIPSLCCISY